MFQHDNFISFHDLSPEARFLWASSSVYDVLGYTSGELVGMPPYDIINTEDIAQTRVVHKENMLNDLVASQIVVRYIAKDGHFVPCVAVFSLCYDFLVSCTTVIHPDPGTYQQLRAHSTTMSRMVGSRKEEFERIKRHHEAFAANNWNMQGMEPEPRVCMILNRFSRNLIIIYASPACEHIFNIDPENIVGKPILLFVRADDLASFVEQMDMVKASTAIANIRFWFQSPRLQQEIPCEAIVFGAADGVMVVMRQCRPFIRKRFIGSRDHYRTSASAAAAAAANSYKSGSHSSSWTSASSASPSSVSSEASLLSMSPPLPRQDQQHVVATDDLNKPTNPPQSLPMSMISRIQILDLDQNSDGNNCKSRGAHNTRGNIRHLAGLKDNPLPVKHGLDLPERFGLKVYNVQDYVEEQDDDDITTEDIDDIDDYGANSDPRSNTRRGCDMELNIS